VLRLWLWRARVPLTVLAALVFAVVVVHAVRPAPEPRSTVLVAATALDAGTVLEAGDVRAVQWPQRLVPASTVEGGAGGGADALQVVGRSLAIAVPEGLPLVDGVLASEEWWTAAPEGSVAAPVRLPDPELAGLVRAGDRVDLYGTPLEGGEAEALARRALVLAGPGRDPGGDGGLLGGAAPAASSLILVAVTSAEAKVLAAHSASAVISAVLVR